VHPASLVAETIDIWTVAPGTLLAGGASVSGSFSYDATTNTYSAVDLTVSDDPAPPSDVEAPADTYLTAEVVSGTSTYLFLSDPSNGTQLQFYFLNALTDDGGSDALGIHDLGSNGFVDYESPGTIPYNAEISSPTPEPGTLLTLGIGLLAVWRKRSAFFSRS
jgi:hypothetical protein